MTENRMHLLHPGGWILDKQMNVIMNGAKIELVKMGIIPKQTFFEELVENTGRLLREASWVIGELGERLRNDKQI